MGRSVGRASGRSDGHTSDGLTSFTCQNKHVQSCSCIAIVGSFCNVCLGGPACVPKRRDVLHISPSVCVFRFDKLVKNKRKVVGNETTRRKG